MWESLYFIKYIGFGCEVEPEGLQLWHRKRKIATTAKKKITATTGTATAIKTAAALARVFRTFKKGVAIAAGATISAGAATTSKAITAIGKETETATDRFSS